MIPVKVDSSEGWAPLCLLLVAVLALCEVWLTSHPGLSLELFRNYGLVPARLMSAESWSLLSPLEQLRPLYSHILLHDGWLHCLVNVWWLWLFGAPVERRLGTGRFLVFSLGIVLASALTHAGIRSDSIAPLVGASGLVAGYMGAYLRVMPRGQILMLIPTAMPWVIKVHAGWFAGAWILLQLVIAVNARGFESDIAWWVHIAGFIVGIGVGGFLTTQAPTVSSVQTDA